MASVEVDAKIRGGDGATLQEPSKYHSRDEPQKNDNTQKNDLAIGCGASWPARSRASAVFLAAAAACLPGAAAAPAESSASSITFSWFTEGGAMPLSFIFVVGVFAATADLVFRQLRWRRNSTAALSPPVFSSPSPSPPPSPPESAERPSPLSRMSKSFVMKSFDENQDGIIDEAEAAAIAEHLAQQAAAEREAQKEAARERKISQVFRRFALVLLLALLASVGINAGLTAGIVYAVKDTRVGDGAQLADDHGAVIRVSEATAHVPLYTLAAMPLDALGRVHQLSVTYSVRSEKEQRHLEIASRSKRGNAVELADALGYTVRLVGTSLAVLVTPDGSKYTVCGADVSCSSVEVSNADLEALELAAIDMRVAEEDEDPSMSDDRRRLHRSDRRRLARRSLAASGCVLDPSPVLGVPGAPCKEGLRDDVDLTQCEKLAASPPADFFPNSLGDSHHPGGQVAGHWSGLPHGCQFFVDGPESTNNRILFNNANSDSALKYNPRNLPTSLCAAGWCLSSYSSMICNGPYRPAHPAESGCFVYLPSGCPNHVSFSSGDWARDDYGENTLNVKSSTQCEKRKGAYDFWCGVSDAVMLFVVDRATQAKKLQQIAEGDDNCQHLSDASKVRTVGAFAIGRPDHLHPPFPPPLPQRARSSARLQALTPHRRATVRHWRRRPSSRRSCRWPKQCNQPPS